MPVLPFPYRNFGGGLNTKDSVDLLTDSQARDLLNVQGSTAGAIVKRNGLVTFSSPAVTLSSLFPFETLGTLWMIGAGGTGIYKISTAGAATAISTGLTSGLRWEFASAPVVSSQGPLFGMNGTDTPVQWSGTGSTGAWTNASGSVAVPNGKFCMYAGNQMFVSGVAANPSRVYWSAIADPTNWDPASLTGAGFEDFDPNDGEAISAIGRAGPYILVAKPRKLWMLVDTASATTRRLSDSVGVIAHRSLASGAEGTYFLAEDRGVYLTNGSKLTPVSDIIQPTIDLIQPGLRLQASGVYYQNHYYLSVPIGSTSNDTLLDYDATLASWWKHSIGSNQFAIWHPGGVTGLYSAKSTAAIVDHAFVPNTTVDNGTPFTWVWRGPWQSPSFFRRRLFPTPYVRKRLRQVRYDGTGTVDFSIAHDFANGETLLQQNIFNAQPGADLFGGSGTFAGSGVFGGQPQLSLGRYYSLGVSNAFSLVFSSTSTTADLLNSYTLLIVERRDLVVN